MRHRSLGTTGVKVSPLCLGAMMFGAMGNRDHDDCDQDHPRGRSTPASTSSTPPTSTRRASPRRSSARRWPADATTWCWPPSSTAGWATTPTSAATRDAGSSARSRTRCAASAPTTSTSTRCTAPSRTPTSTTRSRRCPTSCTRARSATSGRRRSRPTPSSRPSGSPRSAATSGSAASSRRTRSSCAGIESTVLPACERYGMGVIPWSPLNGGLLTGRYQPGAGDREDRAGPPASPSASTPSDPAWPPSWRCIPELEALAADAGMPLTHLAIGVHAGPPGRHAAIIGPRTMEQLEGLLGAGEVSLERRRARPHRRARPARDQRQPSTPAGPRRRSASRGVAADRPAPAERSTSDRGVVDPVDGCIQGLEGY